MHNIPEEIEAMAYLIGQSNQIDQMMVDRPSTLITSTDTLKKGLNDYVNMQRQNIAQVAQPAPTVTPTIIPTPISYQPKQKEEDNKQLEFNLEPTKIEEIIILLREISNKLTKQNNLLEKTHENQSKQKTVSESIVKLIPNK